MSAAADSPTTTSGQLVQSSSSCKPRKHDPVALGYRKGLLRFEVAGPKPAAPGRGTRPSERVGETGSAGRTGAWRFTPAQPASPHDGLPEDAWTGFLAERSGMVSTQAGARPFSAAEQQRILTVGACLTCHKGDLAVMRESVRDFPGQLRRRSGQCAIPVWN